MLSSATIKTETWEIPLAEFLNGTLLDLNNKIIALNSDVSDVFDHIENTQIVYVKGATAFQVSTTYQPCNEENIYGEC